MLFDAGFSLLHSLAFAVLLLSLCTVTVAETTPKPKVLVIGDDIYNAPTATARALTSDRIELVYGKYAIYDSATAVENFDKLLDEKKWDLIHFNFGMNDLMYRAPGIKEIRAMHKDVGGVRVASAEQYEKNLRELVRRFKAHGAKVIWASTTPIVGSNGILDEGSEIVYNEIAAKVMKANDITINDMHSYAAEIHKTARNKNTFSYKGYPLYPPMMLSILKELNLIRPVNGPVKVFIMLGGTTHTGNGIVIGHDRPRTGSVEGTLDALVLNEKTAGQYEHLLDEDGGWATRNDVWLKFDWRAQKSGAHGILYGGDRKRCIGSEYALGSLLGDHYTEQVLVFKTSLGQPSLCPDFIPPADGKPAGKAYKQFLDQVNVMLRNLGNSFPDYTLEAGYELCGLVINIGEQDKTIEDYSRYLPLLIKDIRKEFGNPELPVVIVGSGQGGRDKPDFLDIIRVQQATAARPEFKGNVIFTETRNLWPDPDKSPDRDATKWYGNAESFYKMGEAIGKDMLKLLK
jgi:hypothetical protein